MLETTLRMPETINENSSEKYKAVVLRSSVAPLLDWACSTCYNARGLGNNLPQARRDKSSQTLIGHKSQTYATLFMGTRALDMPD